MPIQPSHITQIPQGPHSTARPVVAGTAIYCDHVFLQTGSAISTGVCSITFDLAVRSTFNVQIVYEFTTEFGSARWYLPPNSGPTPTQIIPRPNNSIARSPGHGFTTALTTAATRDGGTWTVTATGSDTSGGGGQVFLVVIVGSNTEDDCVSYTYGV